MDTWLGLTIVGLGGVGGFVAGFAGVGGGVLMTPLLLYVPKWLGFGGLDMKVVASLTMVQAFFASLSASVVHGRLGNVRWSLAAWLGAAGFAGGVLGGLISTALSSRILTGIFAGFAFIAAILVMMSREEPDGKGKGTDDSFSKGGAIGIGFGVAAFAATVGAGGAVLMIPMVMRFLRVSLREAIGSTLPAVACLALGGTLGRTWEGIMDFPLALCLAIGAVVGAQLGGLLNKKVKVKVLQYVMGGIIIVVSLKMLHQTILG